MPHPVVHFEIACKDGEAGQKFYADLFGWKISADNPMNYGIVEKDGENGIGGGITGIAEGSNHPGVTFYIEADDLQACLDPVRRDPANRENRYLNGLGDLFQGVKTLRITI